MAKFGEQPVENRWWYELDDDLKPRLAASLYTYVADLQKRSASDHLADLENLRLYGQPHSSPYIGTDNYAQSVQSNPYGSATRVTISLAQACLDTLTSKLAKDQPRPFFVTEGGDYGAQQLAKKLQAFNDGVFYETNAYSLATRAFVDAGIFGTGYLHPFKDEDGRIGLERVYPFELLVDHADALYGEPQNLYRVKYIDKGKMKTRFPEFKDQIEQSLGLKETTEKSIPNIRPNRVMVIEAWHLPSGPKAGDGRHTIAVSKAVLVDEQDWKPPMVRKKPSFPIAVMRYNPKQNGWRGQGLCELVSPLQTEMNTLLRKIQICMHFLAVPHWLKPTGSNIGFGAFNNQIGSVINYTGVPPELKVWQSVPPECFQHVNWLYEKAFEVAGISQLSAQSKIPGYGTMSGAALREYSDVESDRFMALGLAWQQFHIELTELFVETAKSIAADKGGYEVTVVERSQTGRARKLDTIDWKDVRLGESKYEIQCQPISKFPRTVAAMMQTGQELVQSGLMSKEMFMDLLGMPDLTAELDIDAAAREVVHKVVYAILDEGDYQAPDPYMDLNYAMKYSTLMLNRAIADGMGDQRIEMLRTWISAADDMLAEAQQAQAQVQAAAQGAMPGQPPPQPLAPTGTAPAGAQPLQ